MDIDGRKFDPLEFWVTPFSNREEEKLDIKVWHPLFNHMADIERRRVSYLFLDEVLGEYGTEQWIGEIKLDAQRLADAIPLEELGEFLERAKSEHGWKKHLPGESAVLYECAEQHARFLRGDVVIGTTMNPRLINEYLKAEGEMEDPLKGTGADYVFVAFDSRILPIGKEATARGKIEDAFDQSLKAFASGRLIGGAWGPTSAYIDLLLFDGAASINILRQIFQEQNLPAGSSINYFAKEKFGHRIVI